MTNHIAPFITLIERIKFETNLSVPLLDPEDGGIEARFLLLLETPGPTMPANGIVSRDNKTGTSRNLKKFLEAAEIRRKDTIIWNAVPFIIHKPGCLNRRPNKTEIIQGLSWLPDFLQYLVHLKVVVLSGRIAAQARPIIHASCPALPILQMPHPSPTYVCTCPSIAKNIISVLQKVQEILSLAL